LQVRVIGNDVVPAAGMKGANGDDVQRESVIGLREFSEEAGAKHGGRSANAFFGGLADEDHGAAPQGFRFSEHLGGAEKNRYVQIVTASVHDANLAAIRALDRHFAGISQAGVFRNGKSVHIGSHINGGAVAVF
jgi:hypothetical protein